MTFILEPFDQQLPSEIFLLITDELASPADFMLHRALHSHLKSSSSKESIIISVSENWAKWESIASRHNINLKSKNSSESGFHFLDVLSLLEDENKGPMGEIPSLRPIYDAVWNILLSENENSLVILDDITTLLWVGFSNTEVINFLRALWALCSKNKTTLIIRHHLISSSTSSTSSSNVSGDTLFKWILELCTYHIEVFPLSSGRSRTVHGQIALHPGLTTIPRDTKHKGVKFVPRNEAKHYRLTDYNATFFARGTAGGVL